MFSLRTFALLIPAALMLIAPVPRTAIADVRVVIEHVTPDPSEGAAYGCFPAHVTAPTPWYSTDWPATPTAFTPNYRLWVDSTEWVMTWQPNLVYPAGGGFWFSEPGWENDRPYATNTTHGAVIRPHHMLAPQMRVYDESYRISIWDTLGTTWVGGAGLMYAYDDDRPWTLWVTRETLKGTPCFGLMNPGINVIGHIDEGIGTAWFWINPPSWAPQFIMADANRDGVVGVQDIFDFLGRYCARNARADCDHNGQVAEADLFMFLDAWFAQ